MSSTNRNKHHPQTPTANTNNELLHTLNCLKNVQMEKRQGIYQKTFGQKMFSIERFYQSKHISTENIAPEEKIHPKSIVHNFRGIRQGVV
jgi:hypothetical protein